MRKEPTINGTEWDWVSVKYRFIIKRSHCHPGQGKHVKRCINRRSRHKAKAAIKHEEA